MWKEIKKVIVVGVVSVITIKVTTLILNKVANLFKPQDDFKEDFDMELDFSPGEYAYEDE